jgi:hypothetical protein
LPRTEAQGETQAVRATPAPQPWQFGLTEAWALNRAESCGLHTVVVLPSLGVSSTVLEHYGERVFAAEHRYLTACLMLDRFPACTCVVVLSREPATEVIDYYVSLMDPLFADSVRSRLKIVVVGDSTNEPVADKLIRQPTLVAKIRDLVGQEPAYIEPWNVTAAEVSAALTLGIPLDGSSPDDRRLAHKSAGRKLMRGAGVPVPFGVEDLRSIEDVATAIEVVHDACPDAPGVVVKLDDSVSGDGNVVIRFSDDIPAQLAALPDWYVAELASGGVVEELIAGAEFSSPSAQLDVTPTGHTVVLSTHEQVLVGADAQIFDGCAFPARTDYAATLAEHSRNVGDTLAERGFVGRFSVDFVSARHPDGELQLRSVEINLRRGGTTHPFASLRNLVPGKYDEAAGQWIADSDGKPRCYRATDNILDPALRGLSPQRLIDAVRASGLGFDRATGTGAVLHMLSGLAVDGRFGVTAIARTPRRAEQQYDNIAAVARSLVRIE